MYESKILLIADSLQIIFTEVKPQDLLALFQPNIIGKLFMPFLNWLLIFIFLLRLFFVSFSFAPTWQFHNFLLTIHVYEFLISNMFFL